MKNIVELRDELTTVFLGLKAGTMDAKAAIEMNNAAGKIINTVKVQLDYSALRDEEPDIEFMKGDNR